MRSRCKLNIFGILLSKDFSDCAPKNSAPTSRLVSRSRGQGQLKRFLVLTIYLTVLNQNQPHLRIEGYMSLINEFPDCLFDAQVSRAESGRKH